MHSEDERLRVGLCLQCKHARLIETPRSSKFYQCQLSFRDPHFPKYPHLPVVQCSGYVQKAADLNSMRRISDAHSRMGPGKPTRQTLMTGVAIKKGQEGTQVPGFTSMGTVRCDHCGQEFSISHPPEIADSQRAEKQAKWLEFVLAEEHQSNRPHADQLELPDY